MLPGLLQAFKFQISEKVDSENFLPVFLIAFMKERIFRGPYSTITDISTVDILE